MLLLPHVLAGMVFSGLGKNPLQWIFFGIFSFFLLEVIPHWDVEDRSEKKVVILKSVDFFVSGLVYITLLTYFAAKEATKPHVEGYLYSGLSVIVLYVAFWAVHWLKGENPALNKISQAKHKVRFLDKTWWGISVQIAICIVAVAILFKLMPIPSWSKLFGL